MRACLTGLALTLCLSTPVLAIQEGGEPVLMETEQADFLVETVATGLEYPWSIAFLPDGNALVSEREGRLRLLQDGQLVETPLAGLPADLLVERQGGLLGLALHPEFETQRWVYFAYAAGAPQSNRTVLARGWLADDLGSLSNVETLFQVNFEKERGFHFGGRVIFLEDGTLLLTLGDGGLHRDQSQNLENHLGTIIRLNADGSVPFDNPYMGVRGAQQEIHSYGHRNVQGIAINPTTGAVWAHEHGARGGDEINIVQPGLNYGWPAVTYGINYDGTPISDATQGEGFVDPIWYWVPSIAPSGMDFYVGEAFANWQGDLFVGALAGSRLIRYEVRGNQIISEEDLLEDLGQRIRDVKTGPDGLVYVLTDDLDGQVLRLRPVSQ